MDNQSINVRLTGEGGQLVGQLNTVAAAEEKVAVSADRATAAGQRAAASAARVAAAEANRERALSSAERAQNLAAISAIRLADAQEKSAQRIARANGTITASQGAVRAGQMQAGQQLQDFFIQIQGGTPVMTAFSQQASQMTGALALMSGGGTAATGIFGRFISLMGGPFGIALGVAIPLVSMLTAKLLENKDAAEQVTVGADNLGTAQGLLGQMFDLSTGKIKSNTQALRDNIYMQMIAMQQAALQARIDAGKALDASGAGPTTASSRFFTRLMGIATKNPALAEARIINQERGGQQLKDLGVGVAQGGISRVDAGRILEQRRKELGDQKYFALQNFLNRAGEEYSANEAARVLNEALGGKLDSQFLDPKKPKKGSTKSGADELKKLAQFGENAAEKIKRIGEEFDAQPKLVDRVNQRTRELDGLIKDLSERKPKGFEAMIKDAQAAKVVVQQALVKPFNDMVEASDRQYAVQSLILAGRDDEAKALQKIYQLQDQVGFVTKSQREAILANVQAEEELNKKLRAREAILSAQLGYIGDIRGQLEGVLGGTATGNVFKQLQQSFKQMQGRLLFEQFLGPAFRELEDEVKKRTGIQSSVDIMKEGVKDAGNAASTLGDSLENLERRVNGLFTDTGTATAGTVATSTGGGLGAIAAGLGIAGGAASYAAAAADASRTADATEEIVVTGQKMLRGIMGMPADELLRRIGLTIADPFTKALDDLFGGSFFSDQLKPVLGEAFVGYSTAGVPGAILGGLSKIDALPDKLQEGFGKALKGAQTGTLVSGIGDMLGIKNSKTGAQIGGAIGSVVPIPGGEIIGSIIGGLVGGLFKKTPKGSAIITSANEGGYTVSGNKAGIRTNLTAAASSVQEGLNSIADQLGATLGNFNVSIGQYKDWYRVSASGSSSVGSKKYPKRAGSDLVYDGQSAEDAVRAAIGNAIQDGALQGLSAAMTRAVKQNAGNLDKAISEALKVKDLEASLGGFLGSAQNAFKQFQDQAKERLRIATAYGLDINKVEELNGKERVKLRQQLEAEAFGSLQDLLDRMNSGDLFQGSAVDQRTAILDQIAQTRDAAARGEAGAADKLAGLLEQLNTISEQVYGTAGGFSQDRTDIQNTAQGVIALLKAQLDAADPNGMDATNSLLDENNTQNAAIIAELKRLGIVLGGGAAPTTTPTTPAYNPALNLGGLAFTGGGRAGISGGGASLRLDRPNLV